VGKGDKPRPYDRDKFNENFDKIFGKKKAKQEEKKPRDMEGSSI